MRIWFFLLFYIIICSVSEAQIICIDPGHGYGPDGENLDSRTWEEINTNCMVALKLNDTLIKQGYTVLLTRTNSDSGSWMSLTQRAELADNYDSDRLLSIHCNGGGGTGTETFWCYRQSPNRAIDSIFSQLVQDNMVYYGEWRNRRSTEDYPYLGFHLGVLKGATPGCLNEIGFVDTPADLLKLQDSSWQKKFTIAYSEAINQSFEIDYPSIIHSVSEEFSVYPNPFRDNIYVKSDNSEYSDLSVCITDIAGRIVLNKSISNIEKNQNIIFNVQYLKPGLYQIKISGQSMKFTRIIVKTFEF